VENLNASDSLGHSGRFQRVEKPLPACGKVLSPFSLEREKKQTDERKWEFYACQKEAFLKELEWLFLSENCSFL